MRRKILPYNRNLKERARELRNNMTFSETLLWNELKDKKMLAYDFDRQRLIGNYIIDFYCKDLMLAIEIDGPTHFTKEGIQYDKLRQEKLESLGVRFLRFKDEEVKRDFEAVLKTISDWILKNGELVGRISPTPPTLPAPGPSQEGRVESEDQEGNVGNKDKNGSAGNNEQDGSAHRPTPGKRNSSVFHFKRFSVRHDRSGMKLGTDGVLLGAWTDISGVKTILDIGTGTGVIALMLAQRTNGNAFIDAVEIDNDACLDASENFAASPWNDRITLHRTDLQSFNQVGRYDLIVSNPPFFQNSLKPPDQKRKFARHSITLSAMDLLKASIEMLQPRGKLTVILPVTEGLNFIKQLSEVMHPERKCIFQTRKNKPAERLLLEFSKSHGKYTEEELILYGDDGEWSEDYMRLTQPFYLKL